MATDEQWPGASFGPQDNAGPRAESEGVMGCEPGAPLRRLKAAEVQANKRWQASLGRLAKCQDSFESIKSEQDKCFEELRTRRLQEAERAEQERRQASQRVQQMHFYTATAGAALGFLGLATSRNMARAVWRFFEMGNSGDVHQLENGVRLLSSMVCLVPASTFILRARASGERKVGVAVLVAGNCLLLSDFMSRQSGSNLTEAWGWGSALLTPVLLRFLSRSLPSRKGLAK